MPPEALKNDTLPSFTGTVTRLGIVRPATQLRFDELGAVSPCGKTVRWPSCCGWVTVTFIVTAVTPEAGTPATPAT